MARNRENFEQQKLSFEIEELSDEVVLIKATSAIFNTDCTDAIAEGIRELSKTFYIEDMTAIIAQRNNAPITKAMFVKVKLKKQR